MQERDPERIVRIFAKTLAYHGNTELSPLQGGKSQARLFRFNIKKRAYVLRILPPQALLRDRAHQISLMKIAGDIGAGPKVHYISANSDALVMDFIDGATVSPETFKDEQSLRQFAQLLRHLHDSPLAFPVAISPFQRFHAFSQKVEHPKLLNAKTLVEAIENTLGRCSITFTPTHLDLHALNIMQAQGGFTLVDWVNGGMSDPYFDLATFAVMHGLDDARTKAFFAEYLMRSPTQAEWDRLFILKPVRPLVIAAASLREDLDRTSTSAAGLPGFSDFIGEHATGKMNWPHRKIGLVMLEFALDLVSQNAYQNALRRLQVAPPK